MDKIGSYKILRRMSSEGGAHLYDAVHEQIERRAVIKVLDQEIARDSQVLKRFLNQARIVNLINYPGIASIYEFGQLPDGSPYIVMEYLQGETLRDRLRRIGGLMEPLLAMRIARQLASSLAVAHGKQVVHRDLKPTSIMLTPDANTPDGQRVKVLNFGIAKLTSSDAGDATREGIVLGTPTYMSPEQCAGRPEISDRSDVYAMGILLYEMLAGTPPFSEAEGPIGLIQAHLSQDPPPLKNRAPEVGTELAALVHRMLAKSPPARPSAQEAAAILARLSGSRVSMALHAIAPPMQDATPAPMPTALLLPPQDGEEDRPAAFAALLAQLTGRRIAIGVAVALLVGIVGISLGVRALLKSPPPPPPILWKIDSQPPDAEVADAAGQVLGRTPWQYSQPPGRGLVTLTLRKRGYVEETVVLDRGHDGQHQLALSALPALGADKTAAPAPPSPAAKRKHKEPRPRGRSGARQRLAS